MMRRTIWVSIAALIFLVSLLVATAATPTETPNDPRVNPDANACYTGGSMEGKCGLDDELWIAGWYEIRLEYGLISRDQVPAQYQWLIHTPEATEEPGKRSSSPPPPPPPCFSLSSSNSQNSVCLRAPLWWTI